MKWNYKPIIIFLLLTTCMRMETFAQVTVIHKDKKTQAPVDSAFVYLSPVTVYAVKGKGMGEKVTLSNDDWVQHDAGQVLQQIPGFSAIRKSGASGYDPVFRGFKQGQLNILNDGALTSTAACPNRMDPPASQVLTGQVQQIEILKGPHSFRYGPSMGGTVNFIGAPAEFSTSPRVFGRVTGGFEGNGEIYRGEGTVGVRTKRMQMMFTGAYSKGHDYKDGNDSMIPARFERGAVGAALDVQLTSNHLLKLTAARNFARNTDFPTLMMDLLTDDTWMLQAHYNITGKNTWYAQWNTQVYASFVDHAMGNTWRPAHASMQALTNATTDTKGGRTEWIMIKNRSKLFLGGDVKYETADGNRTRKMITGTMAGKTFIDTVWQNSNMIRGGLFGEWHHRFNRNQLRVSARLDVVHAAADDAAASFAKQYGSMENTDVNTSFSAGISRQWNSKWQGGLFIGRGVRSAGLTERYINSLPVGLDPYEMMGNPRLKPEANNQADVMVAYKSNTATVQCNGYTSLVTHYISSVINSNMAPRYGAPGVRQYININEALLYGFECSWQQQWWPFLQQQLSVAYTYGKNRSTGEPLPEIAPMDIRYRLDADLLKNTIRPYIQCRQVLQQNRVAGDFGENKTAAFTTIDIGVKAAVEKKIHVVVAVNNLFNKPYREHLSRFIRSTLPLNAPGRSLVVMASYEF